MSKKTDIKTCRYKYCKHGTRKIDITHEEYISKGTWYYHKDCYKAKLNGDWKDQQTKDDLQLIKNLWIEHIDKTVVYSLLLRELNGFIERGIDSEYLVFVMQYVIKNNCKLNYPAGFKYYVANETIKKAYGKSIEKKTTQLTLQSDKSVPNKNTAKEPQVKINNKPIGFRNILGGS